MLSSDSWDNPSFERSKFQKNNPRALCRIGKNTMVSRSLRNLSLSAPISLFPYPNRRKSFNGCPRLQKRWKQSMCLSATKPVVADGILRINGKDALAGVPDNIVVTSSRNASVFLGATSTERSSRHVFKLGVLEEELRLLCLYRFKIWWMIPRVGNSGSDVPVETQMLLLEAREDQVVSASNASTSYILFLPVLDGDFRSSLQGNSANELEYGYRILEKHMGTFSLRETKKMPGMLDWFGWCTWDAFYTEVNPQGIKDGLKSLSDGGTPAKFIIIDDGWQDTYNELQKEEGLSPEELQFGSRLMSIKVNNKFRKKENESPNETTNDLKDFVSEIKRAFNLKYVYVWHALMGYWGGVDTDAPETKKYNSKLRYPLQSPGHLAHLRDGAMDCMEKYGVCTIDPAKISEFYDDQHRYLASQDVDGVKVDVQNILETIGTGLGGRVSLTKRFQQALEKSIAANFQDNSIICCMGQNTDSLYHCKRSAITRASDDYMPRNQTSQTVHIASVAFNSIFLGEIVVPDWDMFYSSHYAAEFHAVARAVGGCGVYVSDKPGQHDFTILKRLVLPDGSVLRAKYPGRPSRDCLFNDPVMDGKSLLKIWNLNKFSGVVGIFNCQGAGSWPGFQSNVQNSTRSELSGNVSPTDIEYLEEVSGETWTGDCAIFMFNSGSLVRLPKEGYLDVSLGVLQCDVFTISPIKLYDQRFQFAPIGLIEMYNSGGAVEEMEFFNSSSNCGMSIKGRGPGRFGAYSNTKPKFCTVNGKEEEFEFKENHNFLTIMIPTGSSYCDIVINF
ncbi:probable galactinol--sucrose galactosyltransferase 2 isoform X3 [Macadamia integrifolia]|uniref:probable galactinol--sucrose galactosyltransferase 2 isoform X3 n=1 Tax=Macadamia integrifolia TaxID=60698 RepID=UPI001C52E7FA|nr:probable galactinol--sucrose galactosyltransferase 2 isoform X3 [Macadamia integrifolia]